MGSYARGRRFEYLVADNLRKAGFTARRIVLSGQQSSKDIINADIIIEEKFKGKAKTTKAKKYVSFPEDEIMELMGGDLDFLAFNFKRTKPFVVIRFDDFIDLVKLWKGKE